MVNAPFRVCVVFSLRSKRFCAEDRGFLSEAGQFPFGKPLTGVVRPRCSASRPVWSGWTGIFGIARLVLLVTMHLVLCFFPCRQARDARHHGWYRPGGLVCWFCRCPSRGAPLGVRSTLASLAVVLGRYKVSRRPSACLLLDGECVLYDAAAIVLFHLPWRDTLTKLHRPF